MADILEGQEPNQLLTDENSGSEPEGELEDLDSQDSFEETAGDEGDLDGGEREGEDEESLTPNAQKAINRQHYLYKEEERKRIALEAEVAQLRQKVEPPNQDPEPAIPPKPDPFDDNFDQLLAQRETALINHAQWKSRQEFKRQQQQDQLKQRQQAEQEALQARLGTFEERATKLGYKMEELNEAAGVVAQYPLSQDIRSFFIDDAMGPAYISFLADNPMELDNLSKMGVVQAALYINGALKGKVTAAKKKPLTTGAPDPIETPQGKGVSDPTTNTLIKGATFE